VGLNLFLSATLFKKTFGQVLRYTAPFVLLMMGCLAIITWVPKVSLVFVEWVYDYHAITPEQVQRAQHPDDTPAPPTPGRVKSLKDLMGETDDDSQPAGAEATDGGAAREAPPPATHGVKTLKDLMQEAGD